MNCLAPTKHLNFTRIMARPNCYSTLGSTYAVVEVTRQGIPPDWRAIESSRLGCGLAFIRPEEWQTCNPVVIHQAVAFKHHFEPSVLVAGHWCGDVLVAGRVFDCTKQFLFDAHFSREFLRETKQSCYSTVECELCNDGMWCFDAAAIFTSFSTHCFKTWNMTSSQ